MTLAGEVIDTVRIDNDAVALSLAIEAAGHNPEVVLEDFEKRLASGELGPGILHAEARRLVGAGREWHGRAGGVRLLVGT